MARPCILNEYKVEVLIPEGYQPTINGYSRQFGLPGLYSPEPSIMAIAHLPVIYIIDMLFHKVEFEIINSRHMCPLIATLIREYLLEMNPFRKMIKQQEPEQEQFLVRCEIALTALEKRMSEHQISFESQFIIRYGRDALPKTLKEIMERLT